MDIPGRSALFFFGKGWDEERILGRGELRRETGRSEGGQTAVNVIYKKKNKKEY